MPVEVVGMEENSVNSNSILLDVKKISGINPLNEDDFDNELIVSVNTVLMTLNQLGFCKPGFYITGESERWSDMLLDDEADIHAIKTWVALRTRLLFDPPTSSVLMQAIKEQIAEYEWRIYINKNFVGEIDGLYRR